MRPGRGYKRAGDCRLPPPDASQLETDVIPRPSDHAEVVSDRPQTPSDAIPTPSDHAEVATDHAASPSDAYPASSDAARPPANPPPSALRGPQLPTT